MHVVVCINYIPDPEVPWREVRLNESGNAPVLERVGPVIGPFDENALEVALQLQDAGTCRVTALSLGPAPHEEALRRALARRCDAAVHLREERAGELDSPGVAEALGAAVRRLGDADLVLCGRQGGDWDGGQVGQLLAEELGFGCVTAVREVEPAGDGSVRVAKEVAGGLALLEVALPAVLTVTNTAKNQLRLPRVKDALAARRAPVTTWTSADVGIDVEELLGPGRRIGVDRVYFPETKVRVRMVDPRDPSAAAEELASYLAELGVVRRVCPSAGGEP